MSVGKHRFEFYYWLQANQAELSNVEQLLQLLSLTKKNLIVRINIKILLLLELLNFVMAKFQLGAITLAVNWNKSKLHQYCN